MRGLTIITVLFASLTFVNVSFTEQKKDQPKKDDTPIEVNASYLEKTGALKFKSASKGSVTNPAKRVFMTMNVVMEFSKDLQEKELTEIKQLLNASPRKFRFVPLDADGVAIPVAPGVSGGAANWLIEGELSGVKGDAFRFKVGFDSDTTPKIKKVTIRPVEPIEDKKQ